MTKTSKTSRLPPAREPSSDQLSRIGARASGLSLLDPAPRTPRVGQIPLIPLPRILLVDDEETFIESSKAVWHDTDLKDFADFEFFLYRDADRDKLVELLRNSFNGRRLFDTVYVDMNLNEGGIDAGIGLIERLRADVRELLYVPFVVITSFPDPERERLARERGAIRFIIKTEAQSASNILGSFVHRMIFEARETLEQAEDQLWADAAARLSETLITNKWQCACAEILEFIHLNFKVTALYARSLQVPNILEEIASQSPFHCHKEKLDIGSVPFIYEFIHSRSHPPYHIISSISPEAVGDDYADVVKYHHATLARIGAGRETFGLLTMYRPPDGRMFRKRDGEGLSRLASLLAAAIAQERFVHTRDLAAQKEEENRQRETERLRDRQRTLLKQIREFDAELNEDAIWEKLRDALFDAFHPNIKHADKNLKVTVRHIKPGTNLAIRACPPRGFQRKEGGPVLLEHIQKSSVARAIWHGKSELNRVLSYDLDRTRFLFRDKNIKSALTVPAMEQGICVGIANLESLVPDAFSASDQIFVEVLAESAAAAILRSRARRLLEGMTDVTMLLAKPQPSEANDLIELVLQLLFDFTGCSEIIYAAPPDEDQPDEPWSLQSIFQRRCSGGLNRLSGQDEEAWRNSAAKNWERSFIYKVLSSGKDVDWSQDPADIEVTDEGLPGRTSDQKTRTQAVIVVRKEVGCGPDAVICLLIQHRNAMNGVRVGLLKRWGSFLASLLWNQREVSRILGLASIREQEARLGQVFSQIRHGLRGRLALIRQYLVLAECRGSDWSTTTELIKRVLTELDREIDRNQSMIKVPKPVPVDLGELWRSIRTDMSTIANENNCIIKDQKFGQKIVTTDRDILRTILFNLVDNAMRHGGREATISVDVRIADGKIYIAVINTGTSIVPSVRKQLFEPMTTTTSDSTGLGLYLSRHRARDLGGDLELVQSNQEGTIFEVSLPNV